MDSILIQTPPDSDWAGVENRAKIAKALNMGEN